MSSFSEQATAFAALHRPGKPVTLFNAWDAGSAQATLIVRLDNVRAIIERTLQTLDNNPQIITELTGTLDNAVGVTGGVLNNTVDTVGDLTSDVLRSGAVLDLANSGLSAVSQTVNAAGQTVRRLRASDGSLYEVVTDAANRIVSSSRVGSPG